MLSRNPCISSAFRNRSSMFNRVSPWGFWGESGAVITVNIFAGNLAMAPQRIDNVVSYGVKIE
jgi:hypothetical protein